MDIHSLTYGHVDLPKNTFYLDRILDRLSPIHQFGTPPFNPKGLGVLASLAAELVTQILHELPILDLMRVRNCSRTSRLFVETMFEFRAIAKHAPSTYNPVNGFFVKCQRFFKTLVTVFE
jgi:hypothetical protein